MIQIGCGLTCTWWPSLAGRKDVEKRTRSRVTSSVGGVGVARDFGFAKIWSGDEDNEAGAEVTPETLRKAGLATRKDPVKILARGDISKALTARAHGFSGTAREKIEAAGGTCEVIEGQ